VGGRVGVERWRRGLDQLRRIGFRAERSWEGGEGEEGRGRGEKLGGVQR